MKRMILGLALSFAAACQPQVQTTSGAAFLADRSTVTDRAIVAAATGEPDLRFPARIGVAQVLEDDLANVPAGTLTRLFGERPDPDPLGQFVPVSPLVAETVTDNSRNAIRRAQLTAARQHLDYVLITVLTREASGLGAVGRGEAILMDVRTGYVYGSAYAETSVSGYGSVANGWNRRKLTRDAAEKVTAALAPDIAALLNAVYARAGSS